MYGELLQTFNGDDMSAFIDFYFEPSPLNNTMYIFRDENAKLDFRDLAVELNLIPEIKEIMEGESKKEKLARNQPKKIKIPNKTSVVNVHHRSKQAETTLDKLMKRLKEETDPTVRANIEKKIESTLKHIDTSK